MSNAFKRLPSRLPAGTKLVIEGRRDSQGRMQISSRYVELPDGEQVHVQIPAEAAADKPGLALHPAGLDVPQTTPDRRHTTARPRLHQPNTVGRPTLRIVKTDATKTALPG